MQKYRCCKKNTNIFATTMSKNSEKLPKMNAFLFVDWILSFVKMFGVARPAAYFLALRKHENIFQTKV